MEKPFEAITVLLIVAATVSILVRRLRLPYTVGLVVTGLALAWLPLNLDVGLTKSLIFTAFLPPLIFEAALQIPWQDLKRDMAVILVLATLGVFIATGLIAAGMHFAAGWRWEAALLFGVLMAATDPVSVIATFKELGLSGRLRLLVEAESLFNDGTAAVLFNVALIVSAAGAVTLGSLTQSFLMSTLGGVVCGLVVGYAVIVLAGRTNDHLVEITFTIVAAYGSFLLAEHFRVSGVLATLTAGLTIGNLGFCGAVSDRGREAVISFWETVAFLTNSLIFLMIGLRYANHNPVLFLLPAFAAIGLALFGRAVSVYICALLFVRSRWRISMPHQHVLVWGGLRGALALALVLGLPATLPEREQLLHVTFTVVVFSVVVQGVTVAPLLRKLGEMPARPSRKGERSAENGTTENGSGE